MKKYFHNEAPGVNADIERHRKEREKLINLIRKSEESSDEMSQRCTRVYTNFLHMLEDSLAEVLTKLGRK